MASLRSSPTAPTTHPFPVAGQVTSRKTKNRETRGRSDEDNAWTTEDARAPNRVVAPACEDHSVPHVTKRRLSDHLGEGVRHRRLTGTLAENSAPFPPHSHHHHAYATSSCSTFLQHLKYMSLLPPSSPLHRSGRGTRRWLKWLYSRRDREKRKGRETTKQHIVCDRVSAALLRRHCYHSSGRPGRSEK